jgi:hypothetical protein
MSKSSAKNDDESWKPLSAENAKWLELMNRHDTVGIHYLQADQLRRKRKLNKGEQAFLKQFDADRKRILRDPASIWQKGFETIHRGIMLIETLIHEKRAQNISYEQDAAFYDAVCMLQSVAAGLRSDFIRYAEEGMPWACDVIFTEGKALASAFSRLAIAYPEHFRHYAEESLTMPSLRVRNPDFTCDAEAIISAIHLAEKHHAGNIHDNRSRIGALCHLFVAERVDRLVACRLQARQNGDTDSKWFNFPELKGNAKLWWKDGLKEWVHLEFEKMRKNPHRNPALWQELEKITDHGTPSAMRAAFEKYCFNKLEQIAGKPVLPPPTV